VLFKRLLSEYEDTLKRLQAQRR